MELVYREDGFPLVEVTAEFNPQTRALVWTIDEGHISRVVVQGGDAAMRTRIENLLEPLTRQVPLRREPLERTLSLTDDLAGVLLNTRVTPAGTDGTRELQVQLTSTPGAGSLTLDLVPMRPGYARRLLLNDERYGLGTPGDLLRLTALATQEPARGQVVLGQLQYRAPVGSAGSYLELEGGNLRATRGLGGTPDRSELHGNHAALAWGHPVVREMGQHAYLLGALEHTRATTNGSTGFARSEATALRAYWIHGRVGADGHLTEWHSTLSMGQRPQQPAGTFEDGERRFQHLRFGAGASGPWQWGQSLMTYRVESTAQWSPRALPAVEKVFLGHHPFLRGYAPAEVSGDRGMAAMLQVGRHGHVEHGRSDLQPFGFVSLGHVSSVRIGSGTQATSWTLAAAGAGLRIPLMGKLGTESWLAVPLKSGPLSQRGKVAGYVSVTLPW
jgi:hemolysin activation/secretion protein